MERPAFVALLQLVPARFAGPIAGAGVDAGVDEHKNRKFNRMRPSIAPENSLRKRVSPEMEVSIPKNLYPISANHAPGCRGTQPYPGAVVAILCKLLQIHQGVR